MAFLDEDIIAYFMNGRDAKSLEKMPIIPSMLTGRGVLGIEENIYEKVQIYRGMDTADGFRVTSGWREKGVFKIEKQKDHSEKGSLESKEICMIGPGYQMEYLNMHVGYFAGKAYLVDTFEPHLFRGRTVQNSVDWL